MLLLSGDYTLSIMNFIVSNVNHFQANSVTHIVNRRSKYNIHRPTPKFTCPETSAYSADIKTFQ
jgi:hypothetical protein